MVNKSKLKPIISMKFLKFNENYILNDNLSWENKN